MSEITVAMSGVGTYTVNLDIVDPGTGPNDTTEVWKAVFSEKESGERWEVYFEMDPDYEVWDLINEAIVAYRDTLDEAE
mgnify:CR=1 FL=1